LTNGRVYVAPLYLLIELLPEILVLIVTLRRDMTNQAVCHHHACIFPNVYPKYRPEELQRADFA
jgi:hypothetical protein